MTTEQYAKIQRKLEELETKGCGKIVISLSKDNVFYIHLTFSEKLD